MFTSCAVVSTRYIYEYGTKVKVLYTMYIHSVVQTSVGGLSSGLIWYPSMYSSLKAIDFIDLV